MTTTYPTAEQWASALDELSLNGEAVSLAIADGVILGVPLSEESDYGHLVADYGWVVRYDERQAVWRVTSARYFESWAHREYATWTWRLDVDGSVDVKKGPGDWEPARSMSASAFLRSDGVVYDGVIELTPAVGERRAYGAGQ